jgi:hypothetical protein
VSLNPEPKTHIPQMCAHMNALTVVYVRINTHREKVPGKVLCVCLCVYIYCICMQTFTQRDTCRYTQRDTYSLHVHVISMTVCVQYMHADICTQTYIHTHTDIYRKLTRLCRSPVQADNVAACVCVRLSIWIYVYACECR